MSTLKNIEKIKISILLLHPMVRELLDIVHDHPQWPVSAMIKSRQNDQNEQVFSYAQVRSVLTRLHLGTALDRHRIHKLAQEKNKKPSKREKIHPEVLAAVRFRCQQQKNSLAMPDKLSKRHRLLLLERVLLKHESVTKVCLEEHISRKRWYKWLRLYKNQGNNPQAFLNILSTGKNLSREHPELANTIIKIIIDHPEYGVVKILRNLEVKTGQPGIKRFRLTTFLQHRQLATAENRLKYAAAHGNKKAQMRQIPGIYTKLSADEKIALMRKIFMGERVEHVCKEAGVALSVFYGWLKKYYKSEGSSKSLEFQRVYPKGEKNPKHRPDGPRRIFEVIVSHPEYGADLISRQLVQKTGQHLLAPSTIRQFLRRQNLNTAQLRRKYAKIHNSNISPIR